MRRNILAVIATACVLTLALGCKTTHQMGSAKTSGFLGDYSQLHEGKSGQALLVYVNPKADFRTYKSVMIESVAIYAAPETDLSKDVSKEDQEMLAQALFEKVKLELQKDYAIVETPGPGVMKVRLAITEAESSKPALDMLTTLIPTARVISGIKRLASGTGTFVGRAGLEGELQDSVSGERLAAAVDRRAGQKVLRGTFSSWGDVQDAYAEWAVRLKDRLQEFRNAPNGNPGH